ncbi:hypothetical protein G6F42_023932 [Rhizopus arrhizus]|nr:hypothetical protein G6F42_023932 [Rhizopus arrhizus]
MALFEVLRRCNLCFKVVKCQFGSTHGVEQPLGHRITTADGVLPLKYNVDKMLQLKTPTNKLELMSALGMFGYFRRFREDYGSIIAQPLTISTRKKKEEFQWHHDEQQEAFDMSLTLLTSNPILAAFPDRKQV